MTRRKIGSLMGVVLAALLCSFILPAQAKEFTVFASSPKESVKAITVGTSLPDAESSKSEENNVATEMVNAVVTVGSGPAVAEANMEADSNAHDVAIDGGIYDEQMEEDDIPVLRVVSQYGDADEDVPVVKVISDKTEVAKMTTFTVRQESVEDSIPVIRVRAYEYPEVPLYFQNDYPDTPYGNYGTIKSHGCGITCVAMVFSYLFDQPIMPDELAEEFGHYNTPDGSYHSLFPDSGEKYGIYVEETYDWDAVVEALENGQVVIANPTHDLFTSGGHFIVLYGITEDGRILVRDPSEYNYLSSNSILRGGFENGFWQSDIKYTCMPCYIYPLK